MELKESVANLLQVNEQLKRQIADFNMTFRKFLAYINSIA
ncbi:hypothetical protein JCM39194_14440 [Desulfotomaculum varum]